MALCKYAGQLEHYKTVMRFLFGADSPLLEREPTDEAFEVMYEMLKENSAAQRAADFVPTPYGFMPGAGAAAIYIAKIAVALVDHHLAINIKICAPFDFFDKPRCFEHNNQTLFRMNLMMIRQTVNVKFKSKLAIALNDGEGVPCTNEQ